MSTPPTEPAVSQPTQPYPPAQSYPPAQHTGGYADGVPSDQPTVAYGQPATAPAADTRPKALSFAALAVAVAGIVLVGLAFLPVVWLSFVFALLGGLLLLVALILGIVVLANRRQGGKGLGIATLVISVVGGFTAIGAIVFSLLLAGFTAVTAADESLRSTSSDAATDDAAPDGSTTDDGTGDEGAEDEGAGDVVYDEAAYLSSVRPELVAIMQEAVPGISEDEITSVYSDEMLVMLGKPFAGLDDAAIADNRDPFITSMVSTSDGLFTEDHAARLYDAIVKASRQHLAE